MRTDFLTDFPTQFPERVGIVVVGGGDTGFIEQNEQIPIAVSVMVATGT